MEYRELAEKSGIEHWRRVPALNTDERFIADMADIVVSKRVQYNTVWYYPSHSLLRIIILTLVPARSPSHLLNLSPFSFLLSLRWRH